MELKIGINFEKEITTKHEHSAASVGSGLLNVYATPMMIALMEDTSATLVMPYLQDGYTTVGTKVNASHISATPIGMKVRAKSTLIAVDGNKLTFEVEAFDECGKIGDAVHERFIVNSDRFMQKTYNKKGGE